MNDARSYYVYILASRHTGRFISASPTTFAFASSSW